jgi:hypothetical protein
MELFGVAFSVGFLANPPESLDVWIDLSVSAFTGT